ncbi:TetR/AcrR family transcriptional regulator [Virgibacillus byunsanensis]|uniref:TetR/AcrR family transcriptional regulator n=1 Tax=Virgibacillus byunsanensis TaxID=570945 RepID=A0ABW3LQ53_9BACI
MSLRERKSAKKKEEIIRSAVSILSEKGYHGTTMEEIASKLLMTKGSVYYYFKDKQDLLYQIQLMILHQSITNMNDIQKLDLPVSDILRKAMIVHIEYLISEKSGFELMINPEEIFSTSQLDEIFRLRDEYGMCFDQLIVQGIDKGDFVSVDIKIVRNIILGAMNWVTQWYSYEGKMNKTEIATMISEYLMQILITDKRKHTS